MDEYMFRNHLERCKSVFEETSYLEIFSYSDPALNSVEQHLLPPDEIENFVYGREKSCPHESGEDVSLVGGLRLIIQLNAKDPETFSPRVISLQPAMYASMIEGFELSKMVVESTSLVGPFFWSTIRRGGGDQTKLQIIYRKADVKKRGMTRGWEISLSHDYKTGITSGFCKGTTSSDILACITHVKACILQIGHPMLLPMIIFSHDQSPNTDIKQRIARDWLRRIEGALIGHQALDNESYVDETGIDYDLVNRHLTECHSQVLWKRPQSYVVILDAITDTLRDYWEHLPCDKKVPEILQTQSDFLARAKFFRMKLRGIESYSSTTLQRLDMQRQSLSIASTQYNNRVNFQMAGAQQRLAHASKRDAAGQKTIALVGAIFLPGAFIASIFSMTFFDWQKSDTPSGKVSSSFWIYWVISVPFTLLVVGVFFLWERRQVKEYELKDSEIEQDMVSMERQAYMRTITKSDAMNVPWSLHGTLRG